MLIKNLAKGKTQCIIAKTIIGSFRVTISAFWDTTPITVAAWSKAWTIFARSNTGIVGLNPTQGMNVCVLSM
jgi:hypothetical protein